MGRRGDIYGIKISILHACVFIKYMPDSEIYAAKKTIEDFINNLEKCRNIDALSDNEVHDLYVFFNRNAADGQKGISGFQIKVGNFVGYPAETKEVEKTIFNGKYAFELVDKGITLEECVNIAEKFFEERGILKKGDEEEKKILRKIEEKKQTNQFNVLEKQRLLNEQTEKEGFGKRESDWAQKIGFEEKKKILELFRKYLRSLDEKFRKEKKIFDKALYSGLYRANIIKNILEKEKEDTILKERIFSWYFDTFHQVLFDAGEIIRYVDYEVIGLYIKNDEDWINWKYNPLENVLRNLSSFTLGHGDKPIYGLKKNGLEKILGWKLEDYLEFATKCVEESVKNLSERKGQEIGEERVKNLIGIETKPEPKKTAEISEKYEPKQKTSEYLEEVQIKEDDTLTYIKLSQLLDEINALPQETKEQIDRKLNLLNKFKREFREYIK